MSEEIQVGDKVKYNWAGATWGVVLKIDYENSMVKVRFPNVHTRYL